MKVAAAFFGFLAFCCVVVAALNLQQSRAATFLFSTAAVSFFGASCFFSYEMGREKERGRILTAADLEDNGLYQILFVHPIDANHKPYRSIAVIMNFETKEEKIYKLKIVPNAHPLLRPCHGVTIKNFSALKEAVEKEMVVSGPK